MSYEYIAAAENDTPDSGELCGFTDYPTTGDRGYHIKYVDNDSADHQAEMDALEVGDTLVIDGVLSAVIGAIQPQTGGIAFVLDNPLDYVALTETNAYDVSFTPASTPPSVPGSVIASFGSSTAHVAVSWGAASGAESYKVFRNTSDSTSGAESVATGVEATSYNDTSAEQGIPYWYFVKATNGDGDSDFSASAAGFRQGSASGNDPELSVLLSAIDNTKLVDGYTVTATEGTEHVDGSYPTTATSKAEQLAEDTAAVNAVKGGMTTTTTVLSVTGTLDMSLYVLKTDVVPKAWVVTGHDTYAGGEPGEYPTSSTSYSAGYTAGQEAQAAADILSMSPKTTSVLLAAIPSNKVLDGYIIHATTGENYVEGSLAVEGGGQGDPSPGSIGLGL